MVEYKYSIELENLASSAAEKAVIETLIKLGIDTTDPIKAQRDFAILGEARKLLDDEDFRADLAHLRRWRLALEKAQSQSIGMALGLLITGAIAALVLGIKAQILNK